MLEVTNLIEEALPNHHQEISKMIQKTKAVVDTQQDNTHPWDLANKNKNLWVEIKIGMGIEVLEVLEVVYQVERGSLIVEKAALKDARVLLNPKVRRKMLHF